MAQMLWTRKMQMTRVFSTGSHDNAEAVDSPSGQRADHLSDIRLTGSSIQVGPSKTHININTTSNLNKNVFTITFQRYLYELHFLSVPRRICSSSPVLMQHPNKYNTLQKKDCFLFRCFYVETFDIFSNQSWGRTRAINPTQGFSFFPDLATSWCQMESH